MNPTLEIDLILAAAPLLVVPLGLKLFGWTDPAAERLRVLAGRAAPFAAVAAALSIVPRDAAYQETLGGVLAAAWMAVCLMLAISAVAEIARTRPSRLAPYLPVAACVYLALGALWLLLFRAGVRPMDLPIEKVQLNAVHFHYAGFGAPVLAAQAARWLRLLPGKWDRLASFSGLGVVVAQAMVVIGSVASPLIELEGAVLMAASLVAIAAGTTLIAFRLPGRFRWLLLISSGSVWAAMILAVHYSLGRFLITGTLSIQDMARTHGLLNVVFVTFGLAGWLLAARQRDDEPKGSA